MCLFYFIFYGLRYDSGITEIINTDFNSEFYVNDKSNIVKRLLLDVGFHAIVKGLWISLFLALIIFAYFDLKKSVEEKVYDTLNRCYICHMDKDVFFKYKINFKKHVNGEHTPMNYIYFIIYALTKNPQNATKLENYVLNKFRINDFSWIPSKDTLKLQEQIKKIKDGKVNITSEFI